MLVPPSMSIPECNYLRHDAYKTNRTAKISATACTYACAMLIGINKKPHSYNGSGVARNF